MSNLKDILLEFIPYDSAQKIRSGLVNKHGSQELDSYTFGIELEFIPEASPDFDEEKLERLLVKNSEFQSWADEYIQSERENLNRRWNGDVNSWDETFGPVDPDEWESHNPEPVPEDFNDRDEFSEKHMDWRYAMHDVKGNFRRFSTSDFYEGLAHDMIRGGGDWQSYVDPLEVSTKNIGPECKKAENYIRNVMGEKVTDQDEASIDTWSVSPDGDNVEIRSKHLKQTDFGLVTKICEFVSTRDTSGGTSAHVHVGLPKDFDGFDLLSMSTLTDESAIESEVGPNRELQTWAKLRDSLHKTLITRITQEPKNQTTGEVPSEFVIRNDVLKHMIRNIARHHGTNISAIDKGTVEFRYLSSEISSSPSRFIGWIKYFLILPKIAKSKNKVVLRGTNPVSNNKTLVCVREPGQVRFYLNKETAKVSDRPASDIKGAADPEPSSPPQNADPRIDKLRRLKDKLRAARYKTVN